MPLFLVGFPLFPLGFSHHLFSLAKNSLTSSLCAQRSRTKIQGARELDLKDLLLLPSSPPSLPRLLVLITLGLEKKRARVDFQHIH